MALPTPSRLEAKALVTSSFSGSSSVMRVQVFFLYPSFLTVKGVAQGKDMGVSSAPFRRVTASGQGSRL